MQFVNPDTEQKPCCVIMIHFTVNEVTDRYTLTKALGTNVN